ncbi:MAG TPA: DUF2119 family protein [Candidatus Methanoperedens sp.]|nr:DUF2119 family protein [Candidatus Methanoperedens sp.]HLB69789.1 DUF2119 family protein [Candidatus Methanoperedens sp.]
MFFKIMGSGNPTRLFVAGIHGNEEAITRPVLELLARDIEIKSGRLIMVGLSGGHPYISTLNKAYYDSAAGRKLLDMIHEYRPCIYLELHSYKMENHSKLIDPERKRKIGVPSFTELEEKVLIGSVSPLIRTTEFDVEDFCFTLEIPDPCSKNALQVVLDVLRVIALSSSRSEIVEKLRLKYPEQIGEAEKKFHEFFRDIRNLSFF